MHMWLFSYTFDVDFCQAKPIRLESVMTITIVEEENKTKVRIKMFQNINPVFKLDDHMVVSPIPITVFSLF